MTQKLQEELAYVSFIMWFMACLNLIYQLMTEGGSSVFVVPSCRAESASTLLAMTSLWLNKLASCQGKTTLPDINGFIRTLSCTVWDFKSLYLFFNLYSGVRNGETPLKLRDAHSRAGCVVMVTHGSSKKFPWKEKKHSPLLSEFLIQNYSVTFSPDPFTL